MKKLKMNLFMVAALAIGAAAMSFKMAGASTVFHYTDTANPGVFSDVDNWQPGNSSIACGTGESRPCEMTAEDGQDLQDKLDGKNNTQVLGIVDSKRE